MAGGSSRSRQQLGRGFRTLTLFLYVFPPLLSSDRSVSFNFPFIFGVRPGRSRPLTYSHAHPDFVLLEFEYINKKWEVCRGFLLLVMPGHIVAPGGLEVAM